MSMLNRLSPHVKAVESRRKGKLMEVPRKNLDLGRDSFLFRGPVVWNCLDQTSRECDRVLKTVSNIKPLQKVSFIKGICMNNNKDLDNFLYF